MVRRNLVPIVLVGFALLDQKTGAFSPSVPDALTTRVRCGVQVDVQHATGNTIFPNPRRYCGTGGSAYFWTSRYRCLNVIHIKFIRCQGSFPYGTAGVCPPACCIGPVIAGGKSVTAIRILCPITVKLAAAHLDILPADNDEAV